jgi:hypothetical protein
MSTGFFVFGARFFAGFSAVLLIFPFAFFMPTPTLHRTVGVTPNPSFGRVAIC